MFYAYVAREDIQRRCSLDEVATKDIQRKGSLDNNRWFMMMIKIKDMESSRLLLT